MGKPVPASALPEEPENSLTVIDNRTGATFKVPVVDNSVSASAFKQAKAPTKDGERKENESEGGLRVFDPGFQNTAVISSRITYIDGELAFRKAMACLDGFVRREWCSALSVSQVRKQTNVRALLTQPHNSGYPIEQLAGTHKRISVCDGAV